MPDPTLGDVVTLARALLKHPAHLRARMCARIVEEAHAAAEHMRNTGCAHGRFGDGSLTSAALRHQPAREPVSIKGDYAACLLLVLDRIGGARTCL